MNSLNAPHATSIVHGDEDCFIFTETVIRDIDDHAARLQHWQQEYEQLSSGAFSGSLEEVWFDNIQIFREKTNQVLHQIGRPWEGSRTIGVVLDASGGGLLSGTALSRGALVTQGGDEDLDFRTPKQLDIIAISTGAAELREFACTVWGVDTEAKLSTSGVFGQSVGVAHGLGEFLELLLSNIKRSPGMLNSPRTRKIIEQEIFDNLVVATSDTSSVNHIVIPTSRKGVVDKAKAYVLEHHDDPVTVADLCTALNISRRTLQYSFESVLDINPVAYLRAIRLNRVRRELKAGAGGSRMTVADIAAHWGFWHLSRFAGNYKQMFDELPSETLRKHQ
ncbi:helix-turn-helix domain-containing protein [Herminiimonas sp. CN]|uniref:helix-turn-helix domain-containing protein n=1 Tax=Herminiimonas sp. CN TaxID=1349818 RepID=UPI0004734E58|nr:helix-turn-helix domain-containing protein [Herminiimonas sp. CN]